MTLLEKALAVTPNKGRSKNTSALAERSELALAWLQGRITGTQAATALGVPATQLSGRISNVLVAGYRAGLIKIEVSE